MGANAFDLNQLLPSENTENSAENFKVELGIKSIKCV